MPSGTKGASNSNDDHSIQSNISKKSSSSLNNLSNKNFSSPSTSSLILHDMHLLSSPSFSTPPLKRPDLFSCSLSSCSNYTPVCFNSTYINNHIKRFHPSLSAEELGTFSIAVANRLKYCSSCNSFLTLDSKP